MKIYYYYCSKCGLMRREGGLCPSCQAKMIESLKTIYYCPKCGYIRRVITMDNGFDECEICKTKMKEVPDAYLDCFRWRDRDGEEALMEEQVKTSPEFDQYLFDHKKEIEYEMGRPIREALARAASMPRCPHCGSARYHKLSGYLSSFNTFQCDKCGYKW